MSAGRMQLAVSIFFVKIFLWFFIHYFFFVINFNIGFYLLNRVIKKSRQSKKQKVKQTHRSCSFNHKKCKSGPFSKNFSANWQSSIQPNIVIMHSFIQNLTLLVSYVLFHRKLIYIIDHIRNELTRLTNNIARQHCFR